MIQEVSVARVVADIVMVAICSIPLIVFHLGVEPYHRGFFCEDDTIRYPYKPGTVSRQMLVVIGSIVTLLILFTMEIIRVVWWESPERNRKCGFTPPIYRVGKCSIHRFVVRIYIFLGYFLLGVVLNQMLTDVAKYCIGRLRPHFIDICKPDILMGRGNECGNLTHVYISEYKCTGTDLKKIGDARLSFYSGHASFSFYAAIYLILYMRARVFRPIFSHFVLTALQFLLFGMAVACAYSRVSNFKHHWSDVLFGSIMGTIVAFIISIYIAELPKRRELPGHMTLETDTRGSLVTDRDKKEGTDDCALEHVQGVIPFTASPNDSATQPADRGRL